MLMFFFFSSRRRHTRYWRDWSSDVCSSDLNVRFLVEELLRPLGVLAATNGSSAKLPRAKPALALTFRTPLVPEGVVQAFTAVFRPLFFAPVVIVMLAGFAALDFWLFFIHGISQSAVELLHRPENFLVVFGLAILSARSEERRVGKECRSRWSPYQ